MEDTDQTLRADRGLWAFAIGLYGREGVAEACLDLQDGCGVDVPILLFTAWLGQRRVPLTAERLRAAVAAVDPWRTQVIAPLRAVRRRLKTGPAPAPDDRTEALRSAVKAAELDAERLELATLEALAGPWPSDGESSTREGLERVVAYYHGAAAGERARRAVGTIANALGA